MPHQLLNPPWDSLTQYQVPDWFRDAKFGMWAHWGPQCQIRARRLVKMANFLLNIPVRDDGTIDDKKE